MKNGCCYECEWYVPSDYDPMHGLCVFEATAQDFHDWKYGRRKSMPEVVAVKGYGWSACYGDCFQARR